MPRALRIKYPGAIYHVMNRGDRREPIFRDASDHHASTRRETTEDKARRILQEELGRLGWTASELAAVAKGDVRKIGMARRLPAETAVTLKWIAAELHMGAWTHVSNLLANAPQAQPTNQMELNLCQ